MHFHSHQISKEAYIMGQLDGGMSQHLLSSILSLTHYWEDPFEAVLEHFLVYFRANDITFL